jgi:zinc transport system substrate-binding protein
MRLSSLVFSTSLFALSVVPATAAPKVMASIVPVHALVAAVMDGVGMPQLLLSGQSSEHQASYSPQQIEELGRADLVFIMGQGLELKLGELSGSETVQGKRFVALADAAGLTRLPIRQGGTFAAHDHDHDHGEGEEAGHDHDHENEAGTAAFDPHLWLDPGNAKVMAQAIAAELAKADPGDAARYQSNAAALAVELDALAAEITGELSAVRDKPFVVTHDAFQYFERAFGLRAAGSISDFAGTAPSAQRLKEVRDTLKATQAVCVFREPQFSGKAATIISEGTDARDGVLDPIGATLPPSKGAYGQLLRNLAHDLKACLDG